METKKIVMGVISIAVAIIVLMSMIPIFTDAGASEDTFTNDGLIQMNVLDADSTYSANWDYTKPAKLTIGTTEIDLPTDSAFALNLYCNENFFLRYYYAGTNGANTFLELYKVGVSGSAVYAARANESKSMSIAISEGTITFNNGGTDYEITFDTMYAIDLTGNYVMKRSTESAYLNGDSEIFAHGRTNVAGITVNTVITGNIDDGFAKQTWPESLTITSDEDVISDATSVSSHLDLYTLKELSYGVTNTSTSATGTVTYSQFIVPSEVTAERSAHASPVESTLIGLIPLLMMVGIMLTAIGLFIAKYRKN